MSCKDTGRKKRSIAASPTEVVMGSVDDGQGPPCCCAAVTATPVGTPANSKRPAMALAPRTKARWSGVSSFKPDYSVDYLPTNPWIHQPFEPYDNMRPAALLEKWKV